MSDASASNRPPRKRKGSELLFEFRCGRDRGRCVLRDHGRLGVEVRLFRNGEFAYGRGFQPRADTTRPLRERAKAWAEEQRQTIEAETRTGTE